MRDKNVTYSVFFRSAWTALCLMVMATGAAFAQVSPADSPCDTEYYGSLKARAWLEAQREITQNQNLIFKPDSVLEYTCFDKYLDVLADKATNMFSETKRWGTILDSDSMDNALEALVGKPVRDYVKSNYEDSKDGPYDLLGGRLDGIDHDPDTIAGGSYTCTIMRDVWMKAKCFDFVQDPKNDGFYTFTDYETQDDKRFLPQLCESQPPWTQNIDDAYRNVRWTEDDLVTYLGNLDPAQCGQIPPIPTGLTVKNKNFPNGFQEMICIQPGCHYEVTSVSGATQRGGCVR